MTGPTIGQQLDATLANLATKQDLERFATKEDLKNFATKDDIADLKADIKAEILASISLKEHSRVVAGAGKIASA